jgi:hypothetical protein
MGRCSSAAAAVAAIDVLGAISEGPPPPPAAASRRSAATAIVAVYGLRDEPLGEVAGAWRPGGWVLRPAWQWTVLRSATAMPAAAKADGAYCGALK